MIRCCPLGHRPLGAWLPHRYPPGLATSVCCRKPLFGRALTSRVISVWLALGNPHPVSATDPGGLRGEASVRHLGKQVAGRGAGQGRGSGDHSRSGNLLHGFLIIPAPLPQLCTHCSRQMLSLPACAVLLFPLVLLVLLAAQPPARLDCSPASCHHVPAPTLTAPERTQHQVSGCLLAWPCLSLHVEDECRDRLSSLLLLRAWPRAEPSLNVCGWVGAGRAEVGTF